MKKNIIEGLSSKIDFNTYITLRRVLGVSALSCDLLLNNIQNTNIDFSILIFSMELFYLITLTSNGQFYTKDYKELKKLYDEFIRNYNDLNRLFDFNDPIQIYTMYNYLLKNGYLSKDKNYQFSNAQVRDIRDLMGANVINGRAVCRHTSSMLVDIFNDYGIKSHILSGKLVSGNISIDIKIIDEPKYTKEELIQWVKDNIGDGEGLEEYELLMSSIQAVLETGKSIEFSKNACLEKINPLLRIASSDHAIAFASKDGIGYFLDPTQNRIYRKDDNNKNLLVDQFGQFLVHTFGSKKVNEKMKDYYELKRSIESVSSIPTGEEKRIVSQTISLCESNNDIFDKFYEENSELYNDISGGLLRLKRDPFSL